LGMLRNIAACNFCGNGISTTDSTLGVLGCLIALRNLGVGIQLEGGMVDWGGGAGIDFDPGHTALINPGPLLVSIGSTHGIGVNGTVLVQDQVSYAPVIVMGNGYTGVVVSFGGHYDCGNSPSYYYFNQWGITVQQSTASISNGFFSYNSDTGLLAYESQVTCVYSSFGGNGVDMDAQYNSFIYAYGTSMTTFYPAFDTVGNVQSYIASQ